MPRLRFEQRRIEERIDHREPVGHHVGQRHGDQRLVLWLAEPVLDQHRLHRRVLDHVFIVDEVHRRHAATGVTGLEIALEQGELLGRGARLAHRHLDVVVELEDAPVALRGLEFARHDAHRLAGGAAFAGRAIDEVLAAAEAIVAEQRMQRAGAAAGEMREELSLLRPGR